MSAHPKKVFIHAGFPKTGTTYLQSLLSNNRDNLHKYSLEYPRTRKFKAHHEFAAAIVGKVMGWEEHGGYKADRNSKTRLLHQIAKSSSNVVISSEYLAALKHEQIKSLLMDLSEYEIHAIFTVRPIAKILPSSYQQSLKNGSDNSFEKWLKRRLVEPISDAGTQYWDRHDHHKVIAKWQTLLGAARTHVVIADEKNPKFLPTSFFAVLGMPIEEVDFDKPMKLNRSLNAQEAELVREINSRFDKERGWQEYVLFIRSALIGAWSSTPSSSNATKIELPAKYEESIVKKANEISAGIRALNCEIYGEVDSLAQVKVGHYEAPSQIEISDVASAIGSFSSEQILRNMPLRRILKHIVKRSLKTLRKSGKNLKYDRTNRS